MIDSTDSDDDDFIPPYEPRRHDHEASSSTVERILERMERSDRANTASFAEIRARQDEFQQQQLQMQQRQLELQQQQLEFQRQQAASQ